MNIFHMALLIVFIALATALIMRYVHAAVDGEFRTLARAVSDKEFRESELSRVDALLMNSLPIPDSAVRTRKPASSGSRNLPPVLLAVGVILLLGSVFADGDGGLWLYAGIGCCLLAALVMLATLRRRKWERVARLLRFRADIRRIDGNRAMAAADLAELLKLTPWDDAAWAELSDDLAAGGNLGEALDAIRRAAVLDPGYDEYRMLETSLSLRLGKPDLARSAVDAWAELDGTETGDPRLAIYRAAVELAEGKRDQAAESLLCIPAEDDALRELLDDDPGLKEVVIFQRRLHE